MSRLASTRRTRLRDPTCAVLRLAEFAPGNAPMKCFQNPLRPGIGVAPTPPLAAPPRRLCVEFQYLDRHAAPGVSDKMSKLSELASNMSTISSALLCKSCAPARSRGFGERRKPPRTAEELAAWPRCIALHPRRRDLAGVPPTGSNQLAPATAIATLPSISAKWPAQTRIAASLEYASIGI